MADGLLSDEPWLIRESGYDSAVANYWETVFTVGNGRLGTRGSLEEGHSGEWSGTYLNGVYDSHDSPVIDLVNAPDWLWLTVSVDGVQLDTQTCTVLEHDRALDMARGLLWRTTLFEDHAGRRTRLETLRFASMATRSVCALRVEVTAENHTSPVSVVSGLNGHRRNLERLPAYPHGTTFEPLTRWDKWAKTKHLVETSRSSDDTAIYLEMRTLASDVAVGMAASTRASIDARRLVLHSYERVAERFDVDLGQGETARFDKLVTVMTSRDPGEADPVADRCLGALDTAVRSGRALYVGISSYSAADTARAARIARDLGTPLLIHQPSYSMLNRWIEDDDLLDTTAEEGLGVIAFSPLAQGLLTDKYLGGVPEDSRAGKATPSFKDGFLSENNLERIRGLGRIAEARGQSLAQMALAWALRDPRVSSLVIGASRIDQLENNVAALDAPPFTEDELASIDAFAVDSGVDIWGDARRSTQS